MDLPEVNSISRNGDAYYPDWETIEKMEVIFMNWVKSYRTIPEGEPFPPTQIPRRIPRAYSTRYRHAALLRESVAARDRPVCLESVRRAVEDLYQALLHKTGNYFHYLHIAIEMIEEMYHCGKESSPYIGGAD
ncbi:hypothetical protein IWW34DRAFT_843548 [Fusarium oxysporum f. sp. albedinis]|nr:uncharacterized protein FOBCDRAFT_274379 [Fusarium oxysporum Fo47]EWZ82528.1 hypothetical protein FOWG_13457 [Fusarium oxysporum f. sp. lycopersici MN25]KAH7216809.1 hypothetical protein BKA60DRAFT_637284 [Fusarium oxysporum]KAI3584686.1 hypothetical protein IWW34DRAFT_843548 [Fusarium oxysporum f. sp. albedinis]QKD54745.1 hypothetical protein FOBCDRAFT_274379 [Fusarium oxysporum Fo47]